MVATPLALPSERPEVPAGRCIFADSVPLVIGPCTFVLGFVIVVDDTVSMALVVGIFALVLCSVSAYCRTVASGAVNPLALILFAADQGRAASMLRA